MPELPEVETTLRGIRPLINHKIIKSIIIREPRLRWPVPSSLTTKLPGLTVQGVTRRGKYLLIDTGKGSLIIHLGMSGNLRVISTKVAPNKHDHVDIVFDNNRCLRFRDPRRFGCILWTESPPEQHSLLKNLGPEPLGSNFDGGYLYQLSRGRKVAVKQFIMNSKVVVGIGNIYASESLFSSGIRPTIAAGRISKQRYQQLSDSIKQVIGAAIGKGGTTLRDFKDANGKPGYFKQELKVYGKQGQACKTCDTPIKLIRQGQRATYYCSKCQV